MNKFKIAFDVQNNENSLVHAVKAANLFAKNNPNYHLVLVGDEDKIKTYVEKLDNISILDEKSIAVKQDKSIRHAHKEQNSMNVAIDLLANKQVDALLSPAESSLILASSFFKLPKLPNIERPAFMPMIPTISDLPFLMVDVGANVVVKPQYLAQWAQIASLFFENLYNFKKPKVAIVNIGVEQNKGLEFHSEAYQILSQQSDLNFVGFVEPKYLLDADVQVFVCDGYAGNLILKTLEGAMLSVFKLLKQTLMSSTRGKVAGILAKPSLYKIKEKFDYRNVGAAWIVGLDGIALKAHGSSDEQAFLGALNQVKIALESQILQKIKEKLFSDAL